MNVAVSSLLSYSISGGGGGDQMYTGVSVAGAGGGGAVMDLLDLDDGNALTGIGGSASSTYGAGSGVGGGLSDLGLSMMTSSSAAAAGGNQVGWSGIGDVFGGDGQRFVKPKAMLLSPQQGKGLGIHGTFARRQGNVFLDLTFANKAMSPMGDFAIQFNTNRYF